MKTFLKITAIVLLALVAIKFIPLVAAAALAGLIVAALLGAVGLGLIAALIAVLVGLAFALSPVWIPILAIIGAISLFRGRPARATPPLPPAPTPTAA